MKSSILLLALATIAFSSCTTAYKTGQTPDDVYYSPARPQDEYVRVDRDEDRGYRYDEYYYDDRYLRMKVNNRTRWSELDDWYSFGDRYRYSYYNNNYWNNPWNPNTYWNNYYNPYCHNYVIVSPKSGYSVLNRPRTFNLNTYNNNQLTNKNYTSTSTGTYSNPKINTSSGYSGNNSSNNNNSRGSVLRDIFSGSNNSSGNNNSSSQPRTSNSSSSSSSSGSSSSSSTPAPVRRF